MSFKSILGGILNVAGSVLSIIPVVGPLVGSGVTALGNKLSGSATADAVAGAAATVAANQRAAIAANNAAANSLTTSGIFNWIQNNLVASLAIAAGAALLLYNFVFKKRRR